MITQLSAFNLCLSTVDAALDAIARAEYENLALYFGRNQFAKPLHELDEFEVEEIRLKTDRLLLRLVAAGGPTEVLTDEGLKQFEQALRVASALGAEVFDTGSVSFKGKDRRQIVAETTLFCENLRRVADVAAEEGIAVCLETHGGMTGTPARCLDALSAINHPHVGIGFDPANIVFYEGADPFEELDELLPFIGHVHVKDKVGGKDVADFRTPGDGELDFERLLGELDAGGYGGYVSVEKVSGDTDKARAEELVKAHDFLAPLLQ